MPLSQALAEEERGEGYEATGSQAQMIADSMAGVQEASCYLSF